MIKIEKDFENIPKILQSDNRQIAFDANVLACDYVDEKHRYKVNSVQKQLNDIYHLKCAYCEKKLLDSPKHIEHYRPKKGGYYWLAYSWDNLLLSCGECNSAKSNHFPIDNIKVKYNNETFDMVQNLGKKYNKIEKPQIINPEIEDVLALLKFDTNGKVSSDNVRVEKTIMICNLRRESLCRLREEILVDFRDEMEGHFQFYIKTKDATRFIPTIQQFRKKCTTNNQFYAFRYFILNNIEIFFKDNILLQKILTKIVMALEKKEGSVK